ncbi:hypothetical protein [Hymenobacter cellulosilyticus]|uniref:Uncharacterized protein n=1 Tax=Hymenobacter cellulosilyticus TaxID=2932248 RepID=A0A8T9PZI4_9BACT|nr:hypothetical protein [Hymenobacter cellulosilyticus]UOQ70165.1 hypothetical protein MUN79_15490 [Hymenobacter cellulosilyticus]
MATQFPLRYTFSGLSCPYAQLHHIGSWQQPDPEGELIDAISVLSLASMNDVEDFLVSENYRTIAADEAASIDIGRSEY